tara:strand:+ start:119 stop:307 length:189 start_codon:yes stop_codon:yes gene_type:complete
MAKYKVYGQQNIVVWEDIVKADSEQEAIEVAYRMNYKSGLGLKYMDNLEANTITFEVMKEEE